MTVKVSTVSAAEMICWIMAAAKLRVGMCSEIFYNYLVKKKVV